MTRRMIPPAFVGIAVVALAAFGWHAARKPTDSRHDSAQTRALRPEYQPPVYPHESAYADLAPSESRQNLAATVASSFRAWNLSENEARSINDGVAATIALLATGDTETYMAYRHAYACAIKGSAEAVADRHFRSGLIRDVSENQWIAMSAEEKFKAVASDPESRAAAILKAATGEVRTGLGQRGSIPQGYRAQGLMSGFAPPSPELFRVGADTEWAWAEFPVKIAATDRAILRFEFVRDPAVNAWLLQRAAILAPQSVRLPWLVF